MKEQRELVERALGYPYPAPPRSFALAGARVVDLAEVEVDRAARIPLLAYGSNASPTVLSRKLAPVTDPVPVVRGMLRGFDVVYSAHLSAYGAVPATLRRSPDTEAPVFVAYLTEGQLSSIDSTEPNYELLVLPGLSCRLETGASLGEASAYLSHHGCLLVDGAEVALGAVEARNRRFAALGQRQALEHVRDRLRPGESLERLILDCVSGNPPDTAALDRSEAPQGDAREEAVGDGQGREVQQRPADSGPGRVERGGHRP